MDKSYRPFITQGWARIELRVFGLGQSSGRELCPPWTNPVQSCPKKF